MGEEGMSKTKKSYRTTEEYAEELKLLEKDSVFVEEGLRLEIGELKCQLREAKKEVSELKDHLDLHCVQWREFDHDDVLDGISKCRMTGCTNEAIYWEDRNGRHCEECKMQMIARMPDSFEDDDFILLGNFKETTNEGEASK